MWVKVLRNIKKSIQQSQGSDNMKMITERPIFIIVNYIYAFFIINFYFILSNLLFFYGYYFTNAVFDYLALIFILLIPMGPALGAVFYTMGKLVREKEIQPMKDYLKGYKKNFKIALSYWMTQLCLLFILTLNYFYITETGELTILLPFFIFLLIFILSLNLYAFPILSRYEMKLKNLWIVSAYYFFKHWKLTLLNLTTILAFVLIYYQFASIVFLFFTSVISYLLMFNLKPLFQRLEAQEE